MLQHRSAWAIPNHMHNTQISPSTVSSISPTPSCRERREKLNNLKPVHQSNTDPLLYRCTVEGLSLCAKTMLKFQYTQSDKKNRNYCKLKSKNEVKLNCFNVTQNLLGHYFN